jgi:Zn-dependent peptidase ImmA (M78 family)
MFSPTTVGERVRTLRTASNQTQATLAQRLLLRGETANTLVSRIEAGRQALDEALVERLANALQCTPEYLTRPTSDVLATRPWLRAYADASPRVLESVLADNLLAYEAITQLQLKRIPDAVPAFADDANDDDAIEEFAYYVRQVASVADGAAVGNVIRAAERLGCVVLPLDNELGRHLGLSQRVNGVPFIRVSRPGGGGSPIPGDRQRFTVAHEIGHLTLHHGQRPPETADEARLVEKQAHRFASAFLAPAGPLVDDWQALGGRVTLNALAELKSHWGLSIKALVVRFQQLGIIGSEQATSLYKQISKRGWNKNEPVHTTNETAIWLQMALQTGEHARYTPAQLREISGLDPSYFARWSNWDADVEQLADVIAFTPRASR